MSKPIPIPITQTTLLYISINFLIRQIHLRQPLPHSLGISTDNTTIPPHLTLFVLDVGGRPFAGDGIFIAEDEDILIFAEEAVDVLEFAVGRFRVEPNSRRLALKMYGAGYERGLLNGGNRRTGRRWGRMRR